TLNVRFGVAYTVSWFQQLVGQITEEPKLNPPLRRIWIDSICINQDDVEERSSQSRSVKTLIWPGPQISPSASDFAWRFLDQIYSIFEAQNPHATEQTEISGQIYSDIFHVNFGLPAWDLRWFSRVWVIREMVLSPQNPLLLYGKQSYPWHRLGWAITWPHRKGYTRLSRIPAETLNVNTMCLFRRSREKWSLDALI
ncbi:uncharacterized protein PpBr36_11060, partial [Pyricularia pennisetigena]|uniref:uncharacterized protein n=1 Tax=Pyricularia pennisetigena TaxID=1578925 RepID=UPI001150CF3B